MKMIHAYGGNRPIGTLVFGWLFIISSVVHIGALSFGSNFYYDAYASWPDWLLNIRYSFSWLQRILGISAGIGLLYGNATCRKIAMAIAIFTIATLYWKHHYPAFLQHCRYWDQSLQSTMSVYSITFEQMCFPAWVAHCLLDILFCGSLLFYLTRPSIKKYFSNHEGRHA